MQPNHAEEIVDTLAGVESAVGLNPLAAADSRRMQYSVLSAERRRYWWTHYYSARHARLLVVTDTLGSIGSPHLGLPIISEAMFESRGIPRLQPTDNELGDRSLHHEDPTADNIWQALRARNLESATLTWALVPLLEVARQKLPNEASVLARLQGAWYALTVAHREAAILPVNHQSREWICQWAGQHDDALALHQAAVLPRLLDVPHLPGSFDRTSNDPALDDVLARVSGATHHLERRAS